MEIEGSYETLSFKSNSSFNSNRSLEKAFCRFLMTDLSLLECARYTNIALYQYRIISNYITISPHHHLTTILHLLAVNVHMIDIDVFV